MAVAGSVICDSGKPRNFTVATMPGLKRPCGHTDVCVRHVADEQDRANVESFPANCNSDLTSNSRQLECFKNASAKLLPVKTAVILCLWWLAIVLRLHADNDFPTDFAGADVNIGERLFLETRFSEYFYTNSGGDVNATPPGDPVVATLQTTAGSVPGPFTGQAMNCRQCHLVDEKGYGQFGDGTLGNRTYCDFARRSPVPARDDGRVQTPRNSLALVDAFLPRNVPLFLHYDGQFASAHDLIIGTLTGRNYGWKPGEYATAVHHIANVIRNDDGLGDLAMYARDGRWHVELPGETSYPNVFYGFSNGDGSYLFDPRSLTADLISPEYQMNVEDPDISDDQILNTVATLIEAYMRNLFFSQATNGLDFTGTGTPVFNGSPYDVFVIKNHLPQLPADGETSAQYAARLLRLVDNLQHPLFVTNFIDGEFATQTQAFNFGPQELAGLKLFLTASNSPVENRLKGVANCAMCHSPPAFTDFVFHNTGAAQEEYDAIHGQGSFSKISIPNFGTRQSNYDAYLPPTPNHPLATGKFESPPATNLAGYADLGLWNVYANPDFPAPQAGLAQIMPTLMGMTVPRINQAAMGGVHCVFSGTNGQPGAIYYVLTSTNLQLPAASWTVIATNKFDHFGNFRFDNTVAAGVPQVFYQLSLRLPAADAVLARTIALFKTPTLRDLGQSGPYLHTGRIDSIEDVIRFYERFSKLARAGGVRNADPQLLNISLSEPDIAPLAAFLRSLNEDYTD